MILSRILLQTLGYKAAKAEHPTKISTSVRLGPIFRLSITRRSTNSWQLNDVSMRIHAFFAPSRIAKIS
jgi:hypothetical protein